MEERCQHGVEAPLSAPNGLRLSIFAAKLLAGGGQQRAVRVWAEAGGETHAIATLSPEKPAMVVPGGVVLRGEFALRLDSEDDTVRIYYRFLPDRARAPGARLIEPTLVAGVELEPLDEDEYDDDDSELEDSDGELDLTMTEFYDLGPLPQDGEEEQQADHSEDEDEWGEEYELPSEDDDAEHYDSDNGEDGEQRKGRDNGDGESSKSATAALVAAPAGIVVPDGNLLGPARFSAVENTAGFMRVVAAAEEAAGSQDGGDKEILVLYRYTRFSRTWSGRRGVEACRRTKLHWLRFAVPRAGDMATSLAWAGASLGPLIYPALFRRQLHELWSSLLAATSAVPPQAARVQVVVDVGILRRDDHTPERMEHMRGEMDAKMREAWPEYYHVGMELRLPEPVPDNDAEHGESARTAKRRKVAAAADDVDEEECSVCLDPLESGLAAWPGCRHVFHGACVEKTLAGSDMCPLCRKKLSDQPV